MADPISFQAKNEKSVLKVERVPAYQKGPQRTPAFKFTLDEEDGHHLIHTLYGKEVEQLINYMSNKK